MAELQPLGCGEFASCGRWGICRKTHPAGNESLLYRLPRVHQSAFQCHYILAMTGFMLPKSKAAGFPIGAFGKDGDFETPRPLAAILRDAKRANSPASAGREFTAAVGCKFPAFVFNHALKKCLTFNQKESIYVNHSTGTQERSA